MLKVFRNKNVSKIVLWALLILILPAFVLWGTGSDRGGSKASGPKFVGMIDGKKVTFNDFAESIGAIRCQVIMNYFDQPQVIDALMNSKPFLGKLAWDRLLMAREARKEHIKVSNDEIVNFIRTHPLFARGGIFDDRMYSYILKNNMGLEPRTFEEITRESLKIQKLNDRLTKDVKISDEEIVETYGKANNKLKNSYLSFSADNFTDEAAAEQYEKLKSLMEKGSLGFEAAAAKLGLKTTKSEFFSIGESLEGIGAVYQITEEGLKLKPGEVSGPIKTEKGAVIFTVTDRQRFDEESFKKEKDDYSKKIIGSKKAQHLEGWLREIEKANKINIDFQDYEKYYN